MSLAIGRRTDAGPISLPHKFHRTARCGREESERTRVVPGGKGKEQISSGGAAAAAAATRTVFNQISPRFDSHRFVRTVRLTPLLRHYHLSSATIIRATLPESRPRLEHN